MNAIEFVKTPFYISTMNNVLPLTQINFKLMDVIEFLKNVFENTTQEHLLYIIVLYTLFIVFTMDNHKRQINDLKDEIDDATVALEMKIIDLENHVHYLKKTEKMRESDEQRIMEEYRLMANKIKTHSEKINNKINKLRKEVKMYE